MRMRLLAQGERSEDDDLACLRLSIGRCLPSLASENATFADSRSGGAIKVSTIGVLALREDVPLSAFPAYE